jgi:hypothetical protein
MAGVAKAIHATMPRADDAELTTKAWFTIGRARLSAALMDCFVAVLLAMTARVRS